MKGKRGAFVLLLGLVAVSLVEAGKATAAGPPTIERVSVSDAEAQAGGESRDTPAMSADGRYVAFTSGALDLEPPPVGQPRGVYVRDTMQGTTERINVTHDGGPANDVTDFDVGISADGRFVVFTSRASNIVPGDTNGRLDVFVRDRQLQTTERVSVSSTGVEAAADSNHPVISANGRFVAFGSYASTWSPEDTDTKKDFYVRDRVARTTSLVKVRPSGVSHSVNYEAVTSIADDGRTLALYTDSKLRSDDTNGRVDAYLIDLVAHTNLPLNRSATAFGNGRSSNAQVSADGRYVVFESESSNLVTDDTNGTGDVFVRDLVAQETTRVSVNGAGGQGNGHSGYPAISADGRHVAFRSAASNLVVDDTNAAFDVFVRNLATGATRRISTDAAGVEGNGVSESPVMSADGRAVAFTSDATNLVPDDTNATTDVFLVRTPVSGNPAVQFTKAAVQTSVLAGAVIEYTLTIANTGDVPLTGMVIADPAALDCAGPVPDLAAGAETAVECSYTTTPDDVGTYTNVATLATEELPPAASNAVGVSVVAAPALAVTASADQDEVSSGDVIDLYVTVTNTGNVPVTNVVVDDPSAPACATTVPSLAVGAAQVVSCAYTTTPDDVGTYTTVASARSDQTPSVSSDPVEVTVHIRRQPDLKVRRHGGPRIGDDVYGGAAADQAVVVERPAGGAAEFFFSVQNDGHRADRFTIDRVEPGRRAVRFYAGRSDRDITDEVLSGTYRTARLVVGASSTIRLEMAVPPTAASGADRPVTLRATISGSPGTVDTARALVHVR
ncbi:MAG: PD40 domain-containing protein [Acidimicrobiales bacterium]|nr:PD40 domain-containing protein [Acidimicrobiales bacterium]